MNVLVSSAGRRGALVRLIKEALRPYGGQVFAVDSGDWSAACRLADDWKRVRRCDAPGFAEEILEYCVAQRVRLVIPTIDTELPVYAENRERFRDAGVEVAVSGPQTVAIARDKAATHLFLTSAGLPTVKQYAAHSPPPRALPFPLVVKPRFGSASAGVHMVADDEALQFYQKRVPQPLVQELAQGKEYTVNLFVNRSGQCVYAVPHWRVETRGGEVSKCVTVRQRELLDIAGRLCRHLPDAYGPMCFQAFVDNERVRIIELNARFGGGYPVAHQAGADFIGLLIRDVLGRSSTDLTNRWTDGVAMTRWDDAVFTDTKEYSQAAA